VSRRFLDDPAAAGWCRSLAAVVSEADLDLREPEDAEALEQQLQALDLARLIS